MLIHDLASGAGTARAYIAAAALFEWPHAVAQARLRGRGGGEGEGASQVGQGMAAVLAAF